MIQKDHTNNEKLREKKILEHTKDYKRKLNYKHNVNAQTILKDKLLRELSRKAYRNYIPLLI